MFKFVGALTVFALAFGVLALSGTAQPAPMTWKVAIGGDTPDHGIQAQIFAPSTITINAGDTVTWTMAALFDHTVSFLSGAKPPLREMARVLRPHGGMASLDFFVPPDALWRASWRLYTRLLMPSAGFLLAGPAWWRTGRFLGPNIEEFYRRWPMHRIFQAWQDAGMVDVEDRVMSLGGGLVMWGRKHHA